MDCLICFHRFDNQIRVPLIVRQCGHSACQACLQALFDRAVKYGEEVVKCPLCNSPEPILPGITDLRKVFPVNYLFVQNAAAIDSKPTCDHPAKLKRFICIDPQCGTTTKFCFDCSRKNHSLCTEGCVMEQGYFESNTNFVRTFEAVHLFPKKEVKKAIEKQTADLRNILCSLADEVENVIAGEYAFLQKARNSSDFYLAHSSAFTCEKNLGGAKMTVRMKSEADLFDFAGEVSRFLTTGIWERIGGMYDRLVVDNGRAFMSLNTDVLRENRASINRFLKTEQLAFADKSPNFPKISFPFTMEKYLGSVSKFLKDTERGFVERESMDVTEPIKKTIFEICSSALDEDSVSFGDLEKTIVGKLTQKYPGRDWRLEHLERNWLKVGPDQFTYLIFSVQLKLSEAAFFG